MTIAPLPGTGIDISPRGSDGNNDNTGPVPAFSELLDAAQANHDTDAAGDRSGADSNPTAAGKVHTLDPQGRDVPDPIGMSREVYTQTSRHLLELISRRLKEQRT